MKTKSNLFIAMPVITLLFVTVFIGCEKDEEEKPVAAFSVSETDVVTGDVIYFTDESTNNPTSWDWDFGDGGASNEQNPTHAYESAGTFTASLTVSNAQGSATETKTAYITISDDNDDNGDIVDGQFTDPRDAKTYNTVTIGDQTWMAENLNYAGNVNGNSWYYDDESANGDIYGRLYDLDAALEGASTSSDNPSGVQGICPDGWHLPSDDEWKELEAAVDATYDYSDNNEWDVEGFRGDDAGSALAGNSALWNDGELDDHASFGTSGFTALPGGRRTSSGGYTGIHEYGYWWSTTGSVLFSDNAFFRSLYFQEKGANRTSYKKDNSLSVRCVKD
ncbi:MAG: FISUMP domain-containing protein [Candidatus Delongbacteria bacterium]|jgi:uncharacterized protein (TIGR02145 family)|nr:FISUMP domain-containing protein [Candidatus Delongbacteria bacterium]